jgi:hypothetical protein
VAGALTWTAALLPSPGGLDRVLVVSLPRLHQAHHGKGSGQLRAARLHAGRIDGGGVRLGGALAVWSGDAAVSEEFQQRTGGQWFGVRVDIGQRLADQRDPAGMVTGQVRGLGRPPQQRAAVQRAGRRGVGSIIPQLQRPLVVPFGAARRRRLGGQPGLHRGQQGARPVPGAVPVERQLAKLRGRWRSGGALTAVRQDGGEPGMHPVPFTGEHVVVHRLLHQRVPEAIGHPVRVRDQDMMLDRGQQASAEPFLVICSDRRQQLVREPGPGGAPRFSPVQGCPCSLP